MKPEVLYDRFQKVLCAEDLNLMFGISCAWFFSVIGLDWRMRGSPSIAFLYVFPIVLLASRAPRWLTLLFGFACAVAHQSFGPVHSWMNLCLDALALGGTGLLTSEIHRKRRLAAESELGMQQMLEASPAAIITVNEQGVVEKANRGALELLSSRTMNLTGTPLSTFLPLLNRPLNWQESSVRLTLDCQCLRDDGALLAATAYLSTFKLKKATKLSIIIAGSRSERAPREPEGEPSSNGLHENVFNSRQTAVLRLVLRGLPNKEIAQQLNLSESSVKNSIQQLFAKAGVRTRSQLMRQAFEHAPPEEPDRPPAQA